MINGPPNIKDGMSQRERFLEALNPAYAPLEAREAPDFVEFVSRLSAQLNYYDQSNSPEGTWEDFLRSDAVILLMLLKRYDISPYFRNYEKYSDAIQRSGSDPEKLDNLRCLFRLLFDLISALQGIYDEFMKTPGREDVNEVLLTIKDIDDELKTLRAHYRSALLIYKDKLSIPKLDDNRQDGPGDSEIFQREAGLTENLSRALPAMTELFQSVQARYNHLKAAAQSYVERTNLLERSYQPHTALFITFLGLYDHLRLKINTITGRHLDLYYNNILGIKPLPASSDSVHLLIEPSKGTSYLNLEKGEALQAFVPGNNDPLTYTLRESVSVSSVSVAELKTFFMSRNTQIVSPTNRYEDVQELIAYQQDNPLFDPGAFQKKLSGSVSWPALGEDQKHLSGQARTMKNAPTGLVVASPLLFLPEGERKVNIKFDFDPEGSESLMDYVVNYEGVTAKEKYYVLHEILSSAFIIDYTSNEGWVRVERYIPNGIPKSGVVKSFGVEFTLSPSAGPLTTYDEKIHTGNYPLALPAVRLLVNFGAVHNANSFLNQLRIERITIGTDVKGFSSVKLQNNFGALSAANPFQPFGPLPGIGSFMNIRNTNVFNRYLTDFSLRISWLDLPRSEKGFEEYYKAYKAGITNASFRVGISAVNAGAFLPLPGAQQEFCLFENSEGTKSLQDTTAMKPVDFKKIEFTNNPLLADEDKVTEIMFKDGAVRLELLAPEEAFGHQLYPQVLAEVALNNARKKGKKAALPNPPFVPVIKNLQLDYKAVHSENFKDSGNERIKDVVLIHHHPFGHEWIYPGKVKKNYPLLPVPDQDRNLFIGLANFTSGHDLSLLFQLEEKDFHHTFHNPDALQWSYLDNNTWRPLGRKEIVSDSTNNFINSGIVKFNFPDLKVSGNTILNPDLFWIRASVPHGSHQQGRILAVYPNAVIATRSLTNASHTLEKITLPAFAIKGFKRSIKGVQGVHQPFPSFGGKPAEDQEKLYLRASERLGHKSRPVQAGDIVQVILQEFPEILMVKCFGTGPGTSLLMPGVNLLAVLIPKARDDGFFATEEPKVNLETLYKVKQFLTGLLSPFVKLEVGNPVYEKIRICCKVKFASNDKGRQGYYESKLTADLNRFIAPWLYGYPDELQLGSRIYLSDVLMFIKSRPYVSYVTGFSAVHFFKRKNPATSRLRADLVDTVVTPTDFFTGSTPESVLIPSKHHIIRSIEKAVYEPPLKAGIGNLVVGEEMLVRKEPQGPGLKPTSRERDVRDNQKFDLVIKHTIE